MAWEFTLQEASFRGVKFDVVNTSDEVSRDVQEHLYPYVDGADQEDLGRKARHVSMTAVFTGMLYEHQLNVFLNALNEKGAGELIHPVFGLMPQMQLLNYRVEHDADNYDYASVAVTWVEHQDSNPFFSLDLPPWMMDLIDFFAQDALNKYVNLFLDSIDSLRAMGSKISSSTDFNAIQAIGATVMSLFRSRTSNLILSNSNVASDPRAYIADINASFNKIIENSDLAGPALMASWRNVLNNIDEMVKIPSQYRSGILESELASLDSELPMLQNIITETDVKLIESVLVLSSVTSLAGVVNDIFSDQLLNNQKNFNDSQIQFGSPNETTQLDQSYFLSQEEILTIAADYRRALQRAIDSMRETFGVEKSRVVCESLKSIAFHVQNSAAALLENRPSLTQITIESDTSLHLLAHNLYANYQRANEILKLNKRIRHPNKVLAGTIIDVYAK